MSQERTDIELTLLARLPELPLLPEGTEVSQRIDGLITMALDLLENTMQNEDERMANRLRAAEIIGKWARL
jgi:hypothetical protein